MRRLLERLSFHSNSLTSLINGLGPGVYTELPHFIGHDLPMIGTWLMAVFPIVS